MNVISNTNIGTNRAENQDRVKTNNLANNVIIAVLCDGMGGQNAGSEASELAVNIIYDRIIEGYREDFDTNSIRNLLISSVAAANAVIFDIAKNDNSKVGMGTTCVAMLATKNSAYLVNVGDSRAYIINDDGIVQVTSDHTVVRLLYQQGKIEEKDIKSHPQRNYINKAVGVEPNVEPDYFEINIPDNSKLLLCSDGLSNYCSDDEIFDIVSKNNIIETAGELLINLALDHGGNDNITLALITD